MTIARRTLLKGAGATLVSLPLPLSWIAPSWRREHWARWLPLTLNSHIAFAAREHGDSPSFEQYTLATRDLLATARRYGNSRERMHAPDAVPAQWQHELALDDGDARVLADTMSSWAGVGVYAHARQIAPYSAATILLRHEIAWTELIQSPSLLALDWQAKRRRVLPPLVAKFESLCGQWLSLLRVDAYEIAASRVRAREMRD